MIEFLYRSYARFIPAVVRRRLAPVISSPASLRQFLTYGTIGVGITVLDFGVLAVLLSEGLYRPLSVTVAYVVAGITQFMLNKYWNFRNFDRSISAQAGTYLILWVAFWLATVAWIEIAVRVLHIPPLVAKALFLPVNVVGGYLAVRHLAFGKGIRRALLDVLAMYRGVR